MNKPDSNPGKAAGLFIDIGQSSLQALQGDDAFEFPLERGENGRLTDLCRERLTLGLRGFLSHRGKGRQEAWCAIAARGVSLRRLTIPASAREETERVLRLQIESEFPLPPDELAWGSQPAGPPIPATSGSPARQELLVVAVKKDALEEYAGIFDACGVTARFTLAALARAALHPPLAGTYSVLNIGRTHSEWFSFEQGAPASIRILPWGGETITAAIQVKLGVTHDEAEKLKLAPEAAAGPAGAWRQSAVESAAASLAESLQPAAGSGKIYLTGKSARDPRLAPALARLLGSGAVCESLETAREGGVSSAILGLKKYAAGQSAVPPLILEFKNGKEAGQTFLPPVWKWAAAAAALALAALFFPYAEAILLKPRLEKKLASVNAERARLDAIDQELDFLQYLKQTQPPYLDTLYLLSKSAPQGTRLDGLSLGRRGDISLQAKMATAQQVTDFRLKLIDSGWFSSVAVEEQAQTPDRRVTVRMTAQLNPPELRKPLKVEPSTKKPGTANMAAMMPGMPEGMPMEMGAPMPMSHGPEMKPAMPPDGPMPPTPARSGGRRRRGADQPPVDQP